MMKIIFTVMTMALCGLLAGCGHSPEPNSPEACALVQKAQFPVNFVTDRPVADIIIDGKPARMLIDTGATTTLVTAPSAERLALGTDWARAATIYGIGGASISRNAKVAELQLGGTRLTDQSFPVMAFALRGFPDPAPDGILGNDVLGKFDVDLDLPNSRITLYQARNCATATPPWSEAFTAISETGRFRSHTAPFVPAILNGHAVEAILDTGMNGIGIDRRFALRIGITQAALNQGQKLAVTGLSAENAPAQLHRFEAFAVAGELYKAPSFAVMELPIGVTDMVIGTPWLRRHRVWISYTTRKVFVGKAVAAGP